MAPNKSTAFSKSDTFFAYPGIKAGREVGQIVAAVFRNTAISYADRCKFAKTAAKTIDNHCDNMKANGTTDECIECYRKYYLIGYETAIDRLSDLGKRA